MICVNDMIEWTSITVLFAYKYMKIVVRITQIAVKRYCFILALRFVHLVSLILSCFARYITKQILTEKDELTKNKYLISLLWHYHGN